MSLKVCTLVDATLEISITYYAATSPYVRHMRGSSEAEAERLQALLKASGWRDVPLPDDVYAAALVYHWDVFLSGSNVAGPYHIIKHGVEVSVMYYFDGLPFTGQEIEEGMSRWPEFALTWWGHHCPADKIRGMCPECRTEQEQIRGALRQTQSDSIVRPRCGPWQPFDKSQSISLSSAMTDLFDRRMTLYSRAKKRQTSVRAESPNV